MTVCVTQLNIFACDYESCLIRHLNFDMSIKNKWLPNGSVSCWRSISHLSTSQAGDCLYYTMFHRYLTMKDYLIPPPYRGFEGKQWAWQRFKDPGLQSKGEMPLSTPQCWVSTARCLAPRRKSQALLEVCSCKGLWPCSSWVSICSAGTVRATLHPELLHKFSVTFPSWVLLLYERIHPTISCKESLSPIAHSLSPTWWMTCCN